MLMLLYVLSAYAITMTLLYMTRWNVWFKEDGDLKSFGMGTDQTLFSFGTFSVVVAVLAVYAGALINKKNDLKD